MCSLKPKNLNRLFIVICDIEAINVNPVSVARSFTSSEKGNTVMATHLQHRFGKRKKLVIVGLVLLVLALIAVVSPFVAQMLPDKTDPVIEVTDPPSYDGERNEDGQRHGQGTQTYDDGSTVEGEWKEDEPWNATLFDPDRFEGGRYKKGRFFGSSCETKIDLGNHVSVVCRNDTYVGQVDPLGRKHGQGTYTWASGAKYVGELKVNNFHGQGTYTWASGAKYVGEWKDDHEWNGIQYSADGTVLGTYLNGEWISK